MNIDLEKLKPSNVMVVIMLVVALLVPSHLTLYLFKKDIYFSLDTFRLVMLSVGIATPVLLYHLFMTMALSALSYRKFSVETEVMDVVFFGSILTNINFFLGIWIGYQVNASMKKMIEIIGVSGWFLILVFALIIHSANRKEAKRRIKAKTEYQEMQEEPV